MTSTAKSTTYDLRRAKLSPLRYPGAKSNLAPVIGDIVARASSAVRRPQMLVEPFAGGASVGLHLLARDLVERVLLADADPLVAAFWRAAAADTEWLIKRMNEEPVTLERWDYWKQWHPDHDGDRELAVQCLFLNRTSFSGILHKEAGPLGGRTQTSAYPLGCRFQKPDLARRIRQIGSWCESGRLLVGPCADWATTLTSVSGQHDPARVLAYLDPPYVQKANRLYRQSFTGWVAGGTEHLRLARHLRTHPAQHHWLLSYDFDERLLSDPQLYGDDSITVRGVPLRYCATGSSVRAAATELLLSNLPAECLPIGGKIQAAPRARDLGELSEIGA